MRLFLKNLCILHLSRPPITMILFLKNLCIFSSRQVIHYNETIMKNLCIFYHGQVTYYNKIAFKKFSYFSPSGRSPETIRSLQKNPRIFHHQAGRLEQLNHFQKILVFFIVGQVVSNNQTTFKKSLYFSPIDRSLGTIRPL